MTSPVRLIQLTDLHIDVPSRRFDDDRYSTDDSLQQVMDCAAQHPADAYLLTGDLVNEPSSAAYEQLTRLLAPLPVTGYCLAGNHDDPGIGIGIMAQNPKLRWDNEIQLGDWVIVMLDSHVLNEVPGQLGVSELERLEKTLQRHTDKHVLVCLHHHPIPCGCDWLDEQMVADRHEFFQIVNAHSQIRGILWGHVHQSLDRDDNGLLLMSTPSTCFQFAPNQREFKLDDKPPAFRTINLHADGKIESSVRFCELTP